MLFQLKKLPEIINLTRFLKSFWILYIDQIIVYNAFYSKIYIIKDRCQMHALKVFRSPVWLLLHKLSSPHYGYIRKMRRGDRLPLTQNFNIQTYFIHIVSVSPARSLKTRHRYCIYGCRCNSDGINNVKFLYLLQFHHYHAT